MMHIREKKHDELKKNKTDHKEVVLKTMQEIYYCYVYGKCIFSLSFAGF